MIRTEIVKVTPAIALKYLENNDINRPLSFTKVDEYSHQMKSHDWKLNGENIIISKKGTLLNGQHRLNAVVQSGETVDMCFIFGIDEDTFSTIDTGKTRSGKDVLSISGFSPEKASLLAAMIRLDILTKHNGLISYSKRHAYLCTPQMIEKELYNNPDYIEAVDFILQFPKKNRPLAGGVLCFLYYRFSKINKDFGREWMAGFIEGVGLNENDYRLWVRNKLWRNMNSTRKLTTNEKTYIVIRAWNWSISGATVKHEGNLKGGVEVMKYIALPTDLRNVV